MAEIPEADVAVGGRAEGKKNRVIECGSGHPNLRRLVARLQDVVRGLKDLLEETDLNLFMVPYSHPSFPQVMEMVCINVLLSFGSVSYQMILDKEADLGGAENTATDSEKLSYKKALEDAFDSIEKILDSTGPLV